jgi:hypothetical protein
VKVLSLVARSNITLPLTLIQMIYKNLKSISTCTENTDLVFRTKNKIENLCEAVHILKGHFFFWPIVLQEILFLKTEHSLIFMMARISRMS